MLPHQKIQTYCVLLLFSAKIMFASETYLEEGIREANLILQREHEKAQEIKARPKDVTPFSLAKSFLQSSTRIKELSGCALAMEIAIRTCLIDNPGLSCQDFWSKVRTKQICADLNLGTGEHPGGVLCPGADCPFTLPNCRAHDDNFRTIDGTCNNELYPLIGSAGRATQRYLDPDYADCVGSPREVPWGLPGTREISNLIYQSDVLPVSTIMTLMHMSYGQIIDHDTDIIPISKLLDEVTGDLVDVDCGEDGCSTVGQEKRNCFPIPIPANDALFHDKECLEFIRSDEVPVDDCSASHRRQANDITSWLDLSFVYDSVPAKADALRTKIDGKLRMDPHPFNSSFLPLITTRDVADCRNTTAVIRCFLAGDKRENEQVGLTALHIVFARFHNYIAENLKARHTNWDDEKLYQESRRLAIAVYAHTVYNEYLPPLFGEVIMQRYRLEPRSTGYRRSYINNIDRIDPDTSNVFAAASFRFGHSQVGDKLRFSDPTLMHQEDVHFSKVMFNPNRLYFSGILNNSISGVNALVIGQTDKKADAVDTHFSGQLAGSMFTDHPPRGQGTDLPAINTHRGRDHGIPSYVKWIEFCNEEFSRRKLRQFIVPVPQSFDDLTHLMPQSKVVLLKDLYLLVSDIDLFTGAMLEEHVPGGAMGPTFACLNAKQFNAYKFGDRYFYETSDQQLRFTTAQLDNIREQTLAGIFCKTLEDNPGNPNLELNFQKWVLLQPKAVAEAALRATVLSESEIQAKLAHYRGSENLRVPCAQHPQIDFSLF